MKAIGSRIYYDLKSGDVIEIVWERIGDVLETSIDDDINTYRKLTSRNRDTFDYIELEYGQYREDFLHATSYRVNPKTRELVFSYDKIEEEEETEPIYQEPLTEKVERLEKEQLITMTALVEKHEETLELKKMNEKLQEMNLIALQGVAELNGEVQKLKKEMEASAD